MLYFSLKRQWWGAAWRGPPRTSKETKLGSLGMEMGPQGHLNLALGESWGCWIRLGLLGSRKYLRYPLCAGFSSVVRVRECVFWEWFIKAEAKKTGPQ